MWVDGRTPPPAPSLLSLYVHGRGKPSLCLDQIIRKYRMKLASLLFLIDFPPRRPCISDLSLSARTPTESKAWTSTEASPPSRRKSDGRDGPIAAPGHTWLWGAGRSGHLPARSHVQLRRPGHPGEEIRVRVKFRRDLQSGGVTRLVARTRGAALLP